MRSWRTKKPLTIALLGDSISTGCNASGWAHGAPFQPPYQDLFVMNLERKYGSAITLKNFAVGGTDTSWGLANIGKVFEVEVKPDLVILAFGMNDSAGRPAKDYQSNIGAMVEAVRKDVPDAEFILVATMVGNPDWVTLKQELFPQYRDALAELCGPGIALADMTTLWTEFLQRKQDRDLTGNGVNHPNDFGHRVYAQVLSALLIALVTRNLFRVKARAQGPGDAKQVSRYDSPRAPQTRNKFRVTSGYALRGASETRNKFRVTKTP